MNEIRDPSHCRFFNTCSANLCPLDQFLKSKVWCPEENQHGEICRNPEFRNLQFVKTQKKIAKVVKKKNPGREDYLSFEMLDRDIIVRFGIAGVHSDPPDIIKDTAKWYRAKERRWNQVHPMKKELSMREKERRSERMKSIRKMRSHIQFPEVSSLKDDTHQTSVNTSQKSIQDGHSVE